MDWLALDGMSDQLAEAIRQRAFRGFRLRPFGSDDLMDAECVARITLADIDHVREWERTHPEEASALWRHGLMLEVKSLLFRIDL